MFGQLIAIVIAVLFFVFVMRIGVALLRSLSEPPRDPPPSGELRKVRMEFRCSICGTEIRMSLANDETPEPPRHCMEDMDLVSVKDV
jgi:hypothetical protein